ncbi:DUF3833 domain-containing protein [Vibrio marisflavi]|uniref:Lipoprotein n=1 Tax=Vibrio marisflavi CECT 7928 TaxID=634439 RepID=A0ABM9A5U7_9VIBR|nr:DUF3833 domain-containing protein [Vibrio marisflavi]CAH0540590.1 hypothetical protein VMF7928_02971 [Vibrio marisflavi CECT 7928]
MKRLKWCYLALVIFLAACSTDISDYEKTQPTFNLFEYFSGQSHAWGMVQDYSNKQTRRFEVKLVGTVKENTLTLKEDFVFDDGEKTQRTWVITKMTDGTYQGKADDIIGVAKGVVKGNALHWQYDFNLKVGDSSYEVSFDDWLYRQDERHVFNITSVRKFGIEVARITLFFQK